MKKVQTWTNWIKKSLPYFLTNNMTHIMLFNQIIIIFAQNKEQCNQKCLKVIYKN